ncbi:MAG: hypothetical protein IT425_05565 [Pirellulales bacterium]|nr:hypothetical protein [Pirellulales bacterium]
MFPGHASWPAFAERFFAGNSIGIMWFSTRTLALSVVVGFTALPLAGCGVTRSSDTMRTATEQLLISDAIDRAVQSMNLRTLAGQSVFLDDSKLSDTVDKNYYISTLRQHLLASGCDLRDKREEAEFIVEARAGAVGTDRNDLLFGIPSMNVPQIPVVQPVPAVIPEIPIAKRRDQRGVAKLAVFAYHRASGAPVWQSGVVREESSANDVWIMGAGPFRRGTIYDSTTFAGTTIKSETDSALATLVPTPAIGVTGESLFASPKQFAKQTPTPNSGVALASHQAPADDLQAKPASSVTAASDSPTSGGAVASATTAADSAKPAESLRKESLLTNKQAMPQGVPSGSQASYTPGATTRYQIGSGNQPANTALARLPSEALPGGQLPGQPLPQPRFNSPR